MALRCLLSSPAYAELDVVEYMWCAAVETADAHELILDGLCLHALSSFQRTDAGHPRRPDPQRSADDFGGTTKGTKAPFPCQAPCNPGETAGRTGQAERRRAERVRDDSKANEKAPVQPEPRCCCVPGRDWSESAAALRRGTRTTTPSSVPGARPLCQPGGPGLVCLGARG